MSKFLSVFLMSFFAVSSSHTIASNEAPLRQFLRAINLSYMNEGFCIDSEREEMLKNNFIPEDLYISVEEENYIVVCTSEQVRAYKHADGGYVFIAYTTMGNHAQYEPHVIYRLKKGIYSKIEAESVGLESGDGYRIDSDGSIGSYTWDGRTFSNSNNQRQPTR